MQAKPACVGALRPRLQVGVKATGGRIHGIFRTTVARLRRASIWHRVRRKAERDGFASEELGRFYRYLSTSLCLETPRHTDSLQRPGNYFPGLRSQPVYAASEFAAVSAATAKFGLIKAELSHYTAEMDLNAHPQNLTDRGRWSVLYFYAGGRHVEETRRHCPITTGVIAAFPGAGAAGQAYLSVLEPGTHIEPHCGPTNTRLRAHLGLEVPEGACIRLGTEIRGWEEGRCLVFDDSFEHEVWNDGGRDRVVLIIDFWHPDLTAAERFAITTARSLRWGLRDILHA